VFFIGEKELSKLGAIRMFNPVPKPKNFCKCGCGVEIKAGRKWVSGHNLRRRSKGAIVIKGRSYKKINCDECESEFLRRTDSINRYGKVNYCGYKCANKAIGRKNRGRINHKARKGEYRNCLHCKSEFYVSRSQMKRGGKYCSKKCQMDRQKELGIVPKNFISAPNNKGKNNGRYRHGNRVGSHIQKRKLREKVIERDGGNWCLFCGKPGPGLHLHRVVYGSQGGRYELSNCVQLCPIHHELVHSSKRKWMPILKHYLKTGKLNLPKGWDDKC